MTTRFRDLLSRLTGVSTPFGGISWSRSVDPPDIPTFAETFSVTATTNEALIAFLTANDGRLSFLNAYLDATMSMEELESNEGALIDFDRIASGEFSGLHLPLPNREQDLIGITFHFSDGHVLKSSHGGTGVLIVSIVGFFEISTTFHGGPSKVFHLREIQGPLDLRAKLLDATRYRQNSGPM